MTKNQIHEIAYRIEHNINFSEALSDKAKLDLYGGKKKKNSSLYTPNKPLTLHPRLYSDCTEQEISSLHGGATMTYYACIIRQSNMIRTLVLPSGVLPTKPYTRGWTAISYETFILPSSDIIPIVKNKKLCETTQGERR